MSTPTSYFEQMYARSSDPWSFATRWYDARKHALTVDSLPRRRYRSAFEPGCSTGMLTARLAERCDHLLAVDAVPAAVEQVPARDNVIARTARIPHEWPDGTFDLVVLSEIGYYFDDHDLATLIERTVTSLEPGGDLVAVHWRHPVDEHARLGDDVHELLGAVPGLARQARHEEADFLLEVFTRVPPAPRSVAQTEGLA
ncbi:methyltransferase domain-containing protein [Actinoplanes sp. LDG1-06]|uniref:Methyltransferase domain-containing protein n=1 Tax=Paractinoplanes ovalisporus TaxID=2810368 RepID=A0ABS2A757_9ACTN|nr:class I SAM-dependent methyltransferase [Actinoplanes ovalisporus]MBM2615673.1 methyltransferase domain-containing protein [Actinoplanes ovalisporus]